MNLLKRPLHVSELPSMFFSWVLQSFRAERIRPTHSSVGRGEHEKDEKANVGCDAANQQHEVDQLRRQLELAHATSEQSRADLESAAAETQRTQLRLLQLESHAQQATELRGQVEQEKLARTRSEEQLAGAVADTLQLQARLAQLEGEARRSAARIADLERSHAQAEKERRSAAALLQARTAELREAQMFLTKDDAVEDSEVVRIVELLNAQIDRVAGKIAGSSQIHFGSEQDSAVVEKAAKRLDRYAWIPPPLIATLRGSGRPDEADLVRTSLQAGMAMYTRWLATSWDLGVFDSRGLLEGVYLSMRERGTHQSIRPNYAWC